MEIPTATRRIVLVEDDDDLRALLVTVLEAAGYAVTALQHAEGICEIWPEDGILLLTDYHLPGLTGSQLIGQFRFHHPAVCTILMSAHPEGNALARECGANAFFRKGSSISHLLDIVDALMS